MFDEVTQFAVLVGDFPIVVVIDQADGVCVTRCARAIERLRLLREIAFGLAVARLAAKCDKRRADLSGKRAHLACARDKCVALRGIGEIAVNVQRGDLQVVLGEQSAKRGGLTQVNAMRADFDAGIAGEFRFGEQSVQILGVAFLRPDIGLNSDLHSSILLRNRQYVKRNTQYFVLRFTWRVFPSGYRPPNPVVAMPCTK